MIKTDICYIISHGFAARMLMQTGLIERLATAGKKIAIVLPDIADDTLAQIAEHPNIQLFQADIKLTLFDDDYGFKRRYFLEDIDNNPVFIEKHIHSLKYSKSKHPWKRIRPIYYYIIYKLIRFFPSIRRRFKKNEKRYLEDTRADGLLEKINPAVVVSTYPVNYLEAKFLYAAEKRGAKKIIHLLSWDNITSKGIFPVKADHYICWGKVMGDEFAEYYNISDDQYSICGVPHFDHHINRVKSKDTVRKYGVDPDAPYLFFGMSSPRFAPFEIEIVEELAKWGIPMIVRPHPQNVTGAMADMKWISRLEKLQKPGVGVSFPALEKSGLRWRMKQEDMDELTDIIHFSSIVLNSGSTVSIDGLILDKPVIITAFDGLRELTYFKSARRLIDYTHLKKLIDLGGAEVVRNFEGLKEMIELYISDPTRKLEERRYAVTNECYKTDGNSTDRVVEIMLEHA